MSSYDSTTTPFFVVQIPPPGITSNCDACRIAFAAVNYKFKGMKQKIKEVFFKLTKFPCLSQASLWKKIEMAMPSSIHLHFGLLEP